MGADGGLLGAAGSEFTREDEGVSPAAPKVNINHVTCHTSHVTRHTILTYHTSHVTHPTSNVKRQHTFITRLTSFLAASPQDT
jgi:hypothetical protein